MNIEYIYNRVKSLHPKYIVELSINSCGVTVLLRKIDNSYQTEKSFYIDKCANFEDTFNKELEQLYKYGN